MLAEKIQRIVRRNALFVHTHHRLAQQQHRQHHGILQPIKQPGKQGEKQQKPIADIGQNSPVDPQGKTNQAHAKQPGKAAVKQQPRLKFGRDCNAFYTISAKQAYSVFQVAL